MKNYKFNLIMPHTIITPSFFLFLPFIDTPVGLAFGD
jgi:hypothetical protein